MSAKIKHSKKWVFLLIILMLVLSIVSILYFNGDSEEKKDSLQKTEEKQEQNEKTEEQIKDEDKTNQQSEENIKEQDSSSDYNEINNSNNTNDNVDSKPTNSNNQSNNQPNNSSNNKPIEPPKEPTEWEKLGISEYDYYNSPAWSWQIVDFGINLDGNKKCSNSSECLSKCQTYGNEYLKTHSGGFKCNNVLSHSGNYLGEDFEFFELQP